MASFDKEYKNFNAREFLTLSYAAGTPKEHFLELVHKELEKSDIIGEKLLDLGTGPSVYTSLLASKYYKEITLSEYAESNRMELTKWYNKEEGAFDWSRFVNLIGKLETSDPGMIEERTRRAIKEILPCDMNNDTPVAPYTGETFHCIISSATLECCYTDITSYEKGLKKVFDLLVPGGKLILLAFFGQSHYSLCGWKYTALNINQEECLNALEKAGFHQFEVIEIPNTVQIETDTKNIVYIKAVKHINTATE